MLRCRETWIWIFLVFFVNVKNIILTFFNIFLQVRYSKGSKMLKGKFRNVSLRNLIWWPINSFLLLFFYFYKRTFLTFFLLYIGMPGFFRRTRLGDFFRISKVFTFEINFFLMFNETFTNVSFVFSFYFLQVYCFWTEFQR